MTDPKFTLLAPESNRGIVRVSVDDESRRLVPGQSGDVEGRALAISVDRSGDSLNLTINP